MNLNLRNSYNGIQVPLDHQTFEACSFQNVEFVYAGIGPVVMKNCKFGNVSWRFVGAAENTLNFLHGLYHGTGPNGPGLVHDLIRGPIAPKTIAPTDREAAKPVSAKATA